MSFEVHDTFRFQGRSGSARATYRPDWSATVPWACFENGTATVHLATPTEVFDRMKTKGFGKIVSRPTTA